jgi:hypothetical protein
MNNKIHIFYRHVHQKHNARSRDPNKHRPSWFDYEKCFLNLLSTINSSIYKDRLSLNIIYDGTELDFKNDFLFAVSNSDQTVPLRILLADAGSNQASWRVAMGVALDTVKSDEDILYFLENDYLHLHGWIEKIVEFDKSNLNFDYISLYDHKDKYFYEMYSELNSKLYVLDTQHWRTSPSTCGTFLVKRKTFAEDYPFWFREVQDHFQFQELFEKKGRILLTPVPGLATHCMEGYLSPTINWEKAQEIRHIGI